MNTRMTQPATLLFIVLGAACIAALSGYLALILVGGRASERAVLLEREVALQARRESRVGNAEKLLEDVRDEQEHIASFFISRDDVVSAIEIIEGLGITTRTTVALADVTLAGSDQATSDVLTMRLTGTGTWAQVAHLLALLERLPFHAELTSVSLNTSPGSEGVSTWTLQATLASRLAQ